MYKRSVIRPLGDREPEVMVEAKGKERAGGRRDRVTSGGEERKMRCTKTRAWRR